MRTKRILALLLCAAMCLSICVSGIQGALAEAEETTVTDMIGREVTVTPGSYKKVVCIGA